MKIDRIHHICIAVEDVDKVVPLYEKVLGARVENIREVPGSHKVAFLSLPGSPPLEIVQLLSPLSSRTPRTLPLTRFVAEKGYGLFHLAFHVESLDEAIAEARGEGAEFIQKEPVTTPSGEREIMLEPEGLAGVMIQIVGK